MIISRHIKNPFNDGELIEKQVCAKNARTGPDGKNYIPDTNWGFLFSPKSFFINKKSNGYISQNQKFLKIGK